MNKERMAKMAERIAEDVKQTPEEKASENIDESLDVMVAAVQTIEENMEFIKPESVPRKAALDSAKDVLDTGVKPYLADLIKLLETALGGDL